MLFIAAAVSFLSLGAKAQATWSSDKAHSKLGFSITHLMASDVEGEFKSFSATITTKGDDFANADVKMTAEVASVNTDNDKRDEHLKSPDFFDAAKFPSMTFTSKTFKKVKGDNYKVTGDLTMHGVTKPVTLEAVVRTGTNPMSKKAVTGVKITGKVNRKDFGIGANMGSSMLSEEVTIDGNVEFGKSE